MVEHARHLPCRRRRPADLQLARDRGSAAPHPRAGRALPLPQRRRLLRPAGRARSSSSSATGTPKFFLDRRHHRPSPVAEQRPPGRRRGQGEPGPDREGVRPQPITRSSSTWRTRSRARRDGRPRGAVRPAELATTVRSPSGTRTTSRRRPRSRTTSASRPGGRCPAGSATSTATSPSAGPRSSWPGSPGRGTSTCSASTTSATARRRTRRATRSGAAGRDFPGRLLPAAEPLRVPGPRLMVFTSTIFLFAFLPLAIGPVLRLSAAVARGPAAADERGVLRLGRAVLVVLILLTAALHLQLGSAARRGDRADEPAPAAGGRHRRGPDADRGLQVPRLRAAHNLGLERRRAADLTSRCRSASRSTRSWRSAT